MQPADSGTASGTAMAEIKNMVRTKSAAELASEDLQKARKGYCIVQSLMG
jgi:hypothetical protein